MLEVQAGPAKLADLEITGGHLAPSWTSGTTWTGGGILAEGATVLNDVLVTGNQVAAPAGPSPGDIGDGAEGGGIAFAAGTPAGSQISDSAVSENSVVAGEGATGGTSAGGNAEGGGIAYEGTGSLIVESSTISQNSATGGAGGPAAGGGGKGGDGLGGGIFNSSSVTVQASTLTANRATGGAQGAPASPSTFGGTGRGGGIFSENSSDQIVNSTVFGNTAQGGAAAQGGSPGDAYGGGVFAEGSGVSTTLQSDTLDANGSSFVGGNIGSATPYPFDIHDTILVGGSPNNCGLASPPSSESYNLEDDAADTCGFTASHQDLLGANPQLSSAPADNGGPTQTLAPASTSPVLGAGGQCLDPTSTPPGQPLALDQRGFPRPNPCDIGSFQSQAPRNTVRPAVYGVATRGFTLICNPGSWTGDGTLAFTFAWLRNGVPIPGATTNGYLVRKTDPGQSLVCRVTASGYGSVAASSSLVSITPYPRLTLLRVRVSRGAVVVDLGCRGVDGQRCSGRMQLRL
ncbi:MAG: hypothetical protein JO244_09550, partial [Solirubrobacterales bacterium]|nr:hypothetical protein [Solirubrobacterales bacterium]